MNNYNKNQILIFIIFTGLLLLTLAIYESRAHTIIVAQDGSGDFDKIQDAIDTAAEGDTIRVWEGSYYENVVVSKSVSLVGNGSKVTTIDGEGKEDVVKITADWTNLNGFLVTGSGNSSRDSGIKVDSSSNIIMNNSCENNNQGIYLFTSSDCTITNNNCSSNRRDGIYLEGSDYNTITNNTCENNTQGIYLGYSDSNTFNNNTCSANIQSGIRLDDSDHNVITNNIYSLNNEHGINLESARDCTVTNNICSSNNEHGINLDSSRDCTVTNNTCSSNINDGISLFESDHNIITNNTCSNNEHGINLYDSNSIAINNNTCENNTAEYDGGGIYLSSSSDCVITNNTCENNTAEFDGGGIYLSSSSDCVITNNTCSSNNEQGIYLSSSSDCIIEDNIIMDNRIGIYLASISQDNIARNNHIFNNIIFGINATSNNGFSIKATYNWWGHPSGPYHPEDNPEGKGDNITDNVEFNPWLTLPVDFKVHHIAPDGNDLTGNGTLGNPYQTIQKAIDIAHHWDIVEVAPGTYLESIIVIKRNLIIHGESPETTILEAEGTNTTCTIIADNVEINGFTIRNENNNGIMITNSFGVKIINCGFSENSFDLNLTYSKHTHIINTTFDTVNFNDPISSISVLWPVDLKFTDNHSGFIPYAHLKISDTFGITVFDGYTDEYGRIPQLLILEYEQNQSATIDFNPHMVKVWKDGYLNFQEELTVDSYTHATFQMETHILPDAIISGDMVRHVDMDSSIQFDGSESSGRNIAYFWEFGDGFTSTSPTPSHTYTVPSAYEVNLTVTDDYNNASSKSIIVIVENVIPIARVDSNTDSAFEDEAIEFTAIDSWDSDSDVLSFFWDFGDSTDSPDVSLIHVYQDEGEYEVSLTAMDRFEGESTTTIYITITNIEPWIVETYVDGMHFPGKPLQFSVTADDTAGDVQSLQYMWEFGDGTIAQEQNVTHAFLKAGIFDVKVTVTDNNRASDSTNIQITITDPEITTSVSSTSILQDETVFFNASHELDDGSFDYTWYFGDGITEESREASHIYPISGTFTPRLMINDGTKNTTIFLQEVMVSNVVPVPNIVSDKLSVSEDEPVHFDASSSSDSPTDLPNLIYTWDFGDGSKGAGIEVTYAFSERGNYTVILTVSDGKATRTTEGEMEVQNLSPVANAGMPKVRMATIGTPVILDASGTADTPSDMAGLNFTWKIGSDTVYGKVVSFTFVATGEFTVSLTVRDDDGATSEDTLTFEVSKSSESEDEETMGALSWILVIVMVVLLGVIGFLISKVRDEALYKEMKAMEAAEEAIEMEEVIDEESFKPQDDTQETAVEVPEEQDEKISDAENEVGEGGVGGGKPHPENKEENGTLETAGNETVTVEK